MSQSLVKILVHIVFSTKDRRELVTPEIEPRLYGYIGGIIENNGGRMIIAGGMPDHAHILASVGRIDIGELVGDIRKPQAWLREHGVALHRYGASLS